MPYCRARQFAADIGLTGVIITKMDSTAKGGFAFAVTDHLGVPIKFLGTGEKVEHFLPFEPQSFVAACLRIILQYPQIEQGLMKLCYSFNKIHIMNT